MQPGDFEPTADEIDRNNRDTAALKERARLTGLLRAVDSAGSDVQQLTIDTISYAHGGQRFKVTVECTQA
jgi:hypothetical protein